MKSLLTRLTESIGDEIAKNSNNNIFETLSINKNTRLRKNISLKGMDLEKFIKDLKEENPELADQVDEYIQTSKKFSNNQNKPKQTTKPTPRKSSSSSGSYGGGCGSNSGSCGRSNSGSFGRSYSGCGRSYSGGC